jgi:hypothetical protein
MPMTDEETTSDPEPDPETEPATGERADHHNHAPGVKVPGGAGTDPAPNPEEPGDGEDPGEGREKEGMSPL